MARTSYRPLAGCKLFHDAQLRPAGRGLVTVPLRGVSCFFMKYDICLSNRELPSPCGV